jgi:hypothetical protein
LQKKKTPSNTFTFKYFHLLFYVNFSIQDIVDVMDVQIIIPLRAADTPVTSHTVPVVVSRTNVSPLSYAAFQDKNLVNDLEQFATLYNQRLDLTYLTTYLLSLLLTYQATCKPREHAAVRVKNAIQILETAWKIDIKDWSQNEDLTPEDANGEVVWSTYFVQFINLILQPLRTRSAYIFFDIKGDISGQLDGPGIWRRCLFKSYSLNSIDRTLELQFQIDKQKKGLILHINDIKNFDNYGIYFQHPTRRDCVLYNPFACDEFAQPRYGSDQLKKRIISELFDHLVTSARREQATDNAEVRLSQTPDYPFSQ